MTYTFKLSRRLAASHSWRGTTALVLFAVLASCTGEPVGPAEPGSAVGLVSVSSSATLPAGLSGSGKGVPFGPFASFDRSSDLGAFTLRIGPYSAGNIVSGIEYARGHGLRLILAMTGGDHDLYKTGGVFDVNKWKARQSSFNTATIRAAVAAGVADGTVLGNNVMDEPHNLTSANSWGPAGTMTKARVDEMCRYVKGIFPTLPVGVGHDHRMFEPTKNYAVCDFVISQYRAAKGPVTSFRDGGLAFGARSGVALVFSINLLDGGSRLAGCPKPQTGGQGTDRINCRMTSAQVEQFAKVLGPGACGVTLWRHDDAFMASASNQAAFRTVGAAFADLPAKACRRP